MASTDKQKQKPETPHELVAISLTDRICNDGRSANFIWEEWDQAREAVSRYIVVYRKLNEIPIIWDLMFMLAGAHPCLWYCFPILKAYVAAVMIQFENISDPKSHPVKELTNMLEKWFLLVSKGRMLPQQMVPFFEAIVRVSCREGFMLLLDIWQYFQVYLSSSISQFFMRFLQLCSAENAY
ncbi:unnamed protein product [Gongylonema pulchrum]|uniref:INTS5_C domain-containing protein n=1 Tax=Gongylonema pulchrum TaxID=637853 RepID=A0A183DAJ9_9BILA|nr:unnamed protein product [Gongylonema pulchrum]